MVLDGGSCRVGVESTIVGFQNGQPVLLRPGGTPLEDLERVAGQKIWQPRGKCADSDRVAAPGMLRRHYAPGKPLRLFAAGTAVPAPSSDQAAGLLLLRAREREETDRFVAVETLSCNADNNEAARNLFAALRRLEASPATVIFAETAVEDGLGLAINDRLRRAAAED